MELTHGTSSAAVVDTGEEVRTVVGAGADVIVLGVPSDETPGQVFPVGWVSHAQSEVLKPGMIVVVRSGATVPSQLQ